MRILVVDDDSIVLSSCDRILRAEGHEIVTARSASEALRTLEGDTFDLMLVDVKMPEYDGMYLTGNVKQRWPDLPVIMMSGYPTDETVSSSSDLGAVDFLPKPFLPEELIASVAKAATGKESRQ